jgi:predicted nucleotidyltransferase
MSNISDQLSAKLIKPLDAVTCQILRILNQAAAVLNLDYFVAGATARDLVLVNVFGFTPGRATRDIDFGVAVEGWDEFEILKKRLCDAGPFEPLPKEAQRLRYPAGNTWLPVDIIPFGGVADVDGHIAWPPKNDVVMTVAGFREAQASAIRILIEEDLIVPVASLAGLAVLKLLAWLDRRALTNKDASDLFQILSRYGDAGNNDRLYGAELALLEEAAYDVEMAGARLLGRDAAGLCEDDTRRRIQTLLQQEELVEKLILQMNQVVNPFGDRVDRAAAYVGMFRRGFFDR